VLRPENVGEAVARLADRPRRTRVVPGWMRPLIWLARTAPGVVDWFAVRAFVRKERADEIRRDLGAGAQPAKRP